MSIRTIIEINHDYLTRMLAEGTLISLLHELGHMSFNELSAMPTFKDDGMRLIAQRHHADKITVTIE